MHARPRMAATLYTRNSASIQCFACTLRCRANVRHAVSHNLRVKGMTMRLAIFGATGRVGRCLVEQALEMDYEVIAFVRTPANLTIHHEHLVAIQGDVLEAQPVAAAVAKSEAVLCALGSGLRNPGTVLSEGTRMIVRAMQQHAVERIVVVSALGIGDSRNQVPLLFRVASPFMKQYRLEKERQERIVRESDLAWTIVRPFRLQDGPRTDAYTATTALPTPLKPVSRADLAHFMLTQIANDAFVHQAPAVVGR